LQQQGVLVLTVTEAELHGDRLLNSLRQQLEEAVGQGNAKKVVLNLQQVRSLSSAAFRPLLTLRRHLEERGGQLALCGLAPVVAEAFRATRMISSSRSSAATFDAHPDVAAAVAALASDAEDR
jgi:anti-anti-sigma factor